jgi:hypothetical protein
MIALKTLRLVQDYVDPNDAAKGARKLTYFGRFDLTFFLHYQFITNCLAHLAVLCLQY